jgi:multidrug resistance efflux pump
MDIVRARRRVPVARIAAPVAAVAVLAGAVWSLRGAVHPQAVEPVLQRDSVVTDVVQRGPFAQSVRASGQLVSDRVFVVAAAGDGVVVSLPIRPGTVLSPQTVVATLANPDLEAAVINAQAQLGAAQAELGSVREQAGGTHLDLIAARTAAIAQAGEDANQAGADAELHAQGFIQDLVYREAVIKAEASHALVAIATEKIAVDAAQSRAKIAEAQAHVAQFQSELDASRQRLSTLTVRAGAAGVVQSVAIETGARLSAGAQIAEVADQRDLKAVLDVPETEAHSVAVGMPALIRIQSQSVAGHVVRINPSAQSGSVAVDVVPDESFPNGARPESSVDGTIRLTTERIAVSIARPAAAVDGQTTAVYRLVDGGTRAIRTLVKFGIGTDDRITILSGLAPGQTVIISDTSAVGDASSIRLQ